jgi:prolyl oligopeptidase
LQGISFSHDGKFWPTSSRQRQRLAGNLCQRCRQPASTLDDHILWAKFTDAAWCGDGFYYSAFDAPVKGKEYSSKNEVHKSTTTRCGTPQSARRALLPESDLSASFLRVSVNKERDHDVFLYESGAGAGNNLYVRNLRVPGSQFIQMTATWTCIIRPCRPSATASTSHQRRCAAQPPHGGRHPSSRFQRLERSWWTEAAEVLDGVTFTNGQMILEYSKDASSHAYLYNMDGTRLHEIALPSVGNASFYGKRDLKECFYSFSSFTEPGTVYRYDAAQDRSTVYAAPKVNFKQADFVTEHVFVTSKDGTRVPVFLTYKKGLKRNGKNPRVPLCLRRFQHLVAPVFLGHAYPLPREWRHLRPGQPAWRQRVW